LSSVSNIHKENKVHLATVQEIKSLGRFRN